MPMPNSQVRAPAGDRRAFGRRSCLKNARIVLVSGLEIPCFVVNVSDGGALLQLKRGACEHHSFNLIIEEDDILVACEVAHRTNDRIGVRYLRMPRRLALIKPQTPESPGKVIASLIARST